MSRFLLPLTVGLFGAAILIGLGIWQMQRLAWKEGVLSQIETRITQAPLRAVPVDVNAQAHNFRSVTLNGILSGPTLRVLASQKRIGAGYRLISVLQVGEARYLFDRGFAALNASYDENLEAPILVSGNFAWPDEIDEFTPAPDPDANIWFARDIEAMAKFLKTDPILIVARQIEPQQKEVSPLPVDPSRIPNDHLEYAITWFSLAVIWIIMTAWYMRRQAKGISR